MGAVFAARVLAVLLFGPGVSADRDHFATPPSGAEAIFWSPPIPAHLRLPPRPARVAPFKLHNQGLVQVAYSDPATGVYLGSPSIVRLDEDVLLASHDHFPLWGQPKSTAVLYSKDGGASWQQRALVENQFWSTLLVHRGAVYLIGTDGDAGDNAVSVARSLDGGVSWNRSRVLTPPPGCHFGSGTVPVLLQDGFLYRGMEHWCGNSIAWPQSYVAQLISAPEASDLLSPASWRASQGRQFNSSIMLPEWMPATVVSGGFLEGNAVRLPGGAGVGLLLRCRVYDNVGPSGWLLGRSYTLQHACFFKLRPAPAAAGSGGLGAGCGLLEWQGFVDMPGGGNKFIVRWDAGSGRYLALTNPSIDRYGSNGDARNVLTLVHSTDLLSWRIATTVLLPNDGLPWEQSLWHTGYQYVDWQMDGEDIIAAIRTAYEGANSFHNSNMITFKRIVRFRQYLPSMPSTSPEAALAVA